MKLRNVILSLLTLTLLSACGGSNLEEDFFGQNSGNLGVVDVLALQHDHEGMAIALSDTNTKSFTNDLGYEIELTEASLHFHELNLISEGEDLACVGGQDQNISLHSSYDLMGEDLLTSLLGTAQVPYVYYCSWELMLGAAEADHNMAAFHLSGTWSYEGTTENFDLMGMEPVMVSAPFKVEENGEVIVHPLHIHEGEDKLSVLIGTKYDQLFDGIDFGNASQSEADRLDQVYQNIQSGVVHQHTGAHHGSADHDHG